MKQMIMVASHNDYLEDDDETFELLGMDIVLRRAHCFNFVEYLADDVFQCETSKDFLAARAAESFCADTLVPELERIYRGAKCQVRAGHPVHYVVTSNYCETRREMVNILFSALRDNNRIWNGRYSVIKLNDGFDGDNFDFTPFFKVNKGGMLAIDCAAQHDEDNDQVSPGGSFVGNICEAIKKYKNDVLTVLCLPRASGRTLDIFLENLDGVTFIPLKEGLLYGSAAKQYLRKAAEKMNITPDKYLYGALKDPEKGHMAADLKDEFERWFAKTLRKSVYPQYGELESEALISVKKKPKGSAYKELDEMIGLTAVKGVIKKAVNYYKAQNIFRDRGMKSDNATMHMIFTGNPGSAKTTVARLFARIMKENGLLSRGGLIEVGRGDLIGKYVGWTAQIVKKKFKEARGSVLFIDEAYSLVDDRSGSYGDEAINTIVQEMENNRTDMAVIFAGYSDKMEEFLKTNPGLRSRIAFHVPFEDYSPDEMADILEYMARNRGARLSDGVRDRVKPMFEAALRTKDHGNGRFVRNMFDRARMNQADRLFTSDSGNVTEDEVMTIIAEDFDMPLELEPLKKTIGFAA